MNKMQRLLWLFVGVCFLQRTVAVAIAVNDTKTIAKTLPIAAIYINNNNNNSDNVKNASTVDILQYQTKTAQGADVPKLQLEDAAKSQSNENTDTAANSSNIAKSRRKELDSPKVSNDNNNATTITTTTTTNATATAAIENANKTQQVLVAEGVTLNVTTKHLQQSVAQQNKTPTNAKNTTIASNSTTNSSSTSTSTTTSSTTTTTTTTRKPIPKKPTIVYGVEDFPNLDANHLKLPANAAPDTDKQANVLAPNAEPSAELISTGFQHTHQHDYVLPMLSIILLVPLVTIIAITVYRRFRDFWSTRHYRRMDFLVDGMYND